MPSRSATKSSQPGADCQSDRQTESWINAELSASAMKPSLPHADRHTVRQTDAELAAFLACWMPSSSHCCLVLTVRQTDTAGLPFDQLACHPISGPHILSVGLPFDQRASYSISGLLFDQRASCSISRPPIPSAGLLFDHSRLLAWPLNAAVLRGVLISPPPLFALMILTVEAD